MNKFELKHNIESKNKDPYMVWQFNEAKDGKTKIGELDYILYAINCNNELDYKKALDLAIAHYSFRPDLIADLYINLGRFNEAKNLILNFEIKDQSLYKLMAESFDRFIEINPESEESMLKEIEVNNKEFFNFLKSVNLI